MVVTKFLNPTLECVSLIKEQIMSQKIRRDIKKFCYHVAMKIQADNIHKLKHAAIEKNN